MIAFGGVCSYGLVELKISMANMYIHMYILLLLTCKDIANRHKPQDYIISEKGSEELQ
jgi:hypothetical protein